MLYSICYMLYAICYMLYAICYMLYAICYMLYAICYIYKLQFYNYNNLKLAKRHSSLCVSISSNITKLWHPLHGIFRFGQAFLG